MKLFVTGRKKGGREEKLVRLVKMVAIMHCWLLSGSSRMESPRLTQDRK